MNQSRNSLLQTVVVMLFILLVPGCKPGGPSLTPDADAPVLFGPPGTQFWTTWQHASELVGDQVRTCTTRNCLHSIGTGQDQTGNRYMNVDSELDPVELTMVARADSRYENVDGAQLLFHQTPEEGAPWMAASSSAFYLKKMPESFEKIGLIDGAYRDIDDQKILMTRGVSEGQLWTGDSQGIVYRAQIDGSIVRVGEYMRKWITPEGEDQRLLLPVMMTRSIKPNAPWVGSWGGSLYVGHDQ